MRSGLQTLRLILLVLMLPFHLLAQSTAIKIVPSVDQRVELLSIVFRLAGNPEYNMSQLTKYTSDIDSYFAPYKNHPAVLRARSLAQQKGVCFDAVMKMAVHLSDPPELKPLVPFTDEIPDSRWGQKNAEEFAPLLRQFYVDTKFDKFFAVHAPLYRVTESRFQTVLEQLNVGWYQKFYGELPTGDFHLFLALNNGFGNYGPRVVFPNGKMEIFAIIGCAQADSSGDPTFNSSDLDMIVHEFNHSFVNPLVDAHKADLVPAEKVYLPVSDKLRKLAYGDAQTMLYESLVRAAIILYFESAGETKQQIKTRVVNEQSLGFVWMDELCDLLRRFESQRDRYPKLRDFMGNVVEYYGGLSSRIGEKVTAFQSKCVHVTGLSPFANHAQDVDPAIREIVVTFDKPVDRTRGYSINFGLEGKEHYPLAGVPMFASERTLKLPVNVKSNWTYSFILTPYNFLSLDGYPLESYAVDFKTK